jgi:tRNA pseudouridine55 synthase
MVCIILFNTWPVTNTVYLTVVENCLDFEKGEVLLLEKPLYWTSFDLVNKIKMALRHHCGFKKLKVGHAGTLDPLATGLMIVCTGKATKRIEEFKDLNKEYTAKIRFGQTTSSFDLESQVDREYPADHITAELIREKLTEFLGEQYQEPPLFSAKFVEGKRAYELARKKIERKLEKVKVFFHEIELLDYSEKEARVRIVCSKGTYIRAFARDLGLSMGSGAHLTGLIRNAIGDYRIEKALTVEEFRFIIENMKQNDISYV